MVKCLSGWNFLDKSAVWLNNRRVSKAFAFFLHQLRFPWHSFTKTSKIHRGSMFQHSKIHYFWHSEHHSRLHCCHNSGRSLEPQPKQDSTKKKKAAGLNCGNVLAIHPLSVSCLDIISDFAVGFGRGTKSSCRRSTKPTSFTTQFHMWDQDSLLQAFSPFKNLLSFWTRSSLLFLSSL